LGACDCLLQHHRETAARFGRASRRLYRMVAPWPRHQPQAGRTAADDHARCRILECRYGFHHRVATAAADTRVIVLLRDGRIRAVQYQKDGPWNGYTKDHLE